MVSKSRYYRKSMLNFQGKSTYQHILISHSYLFLPPLKTHHVFNKAKINNSVHMVEEDI